MSFDLALQGRRALVTGSSLVFHNSNNRSDVMQNRLSRIFCGAAILVVTLLFTGNFVPQHSSAEDPPQVASKTADAKADQTPQLFELRIYTAAPGKMEALHKRFRDHTLRLFEKHGIKSIGYWTAADEQKQERLYYIVAYPDRASRQKMLIKGIAADPEFHQAVAESDKDGKLTTEIESVLLTPTEYSALK